MMKLFFVDPMSYNNLSIYDWNLIENIDADVYFFGSSKYDYKTLNAKAKFIYNYNKRSSTLLKTLFYVLNSLLLFNYILMHKPNIVHFQWFKLPVYDVFFIKLINIFSRKTKIIYTAHNYLPHDTGNKYLKYYKYIYNLVDRIFVHTETTKKQIEELINNHLKVKVVEHGIIQMDYDHKIAQKIKKGISNKYQLDSKLICLYIGQVHKYKGVDILINAWNHSSKLKENSNISLIIAGKGDKELVKSNANNVIIDNRFLTNEEFVAYIELADLILLPYRSISQSGVLLTILNFKKPILVSNVGGLPDPLKKARIGWILQDLEEDTLMKKILEIVSDKKTLENIKNDQNAWSTIQNLYSWEKIGMNTTKLYTELLSENNVN